MICLCLTFSRLLVRMVSSCKTWFNGIRSVLIARSYMEVVKESAGFGACKRQYRKKGSSVVVLLHGALQSETHMTVSLLWGDIGRRRRWGPKSLPVCRVLKQPLTPSFIAQGTLELHGRKCSPRMHTHAITLISETGSVFCIFPLRYRHK